MEFITIKQDENLEQVLHFTGKTAETFINEILNYLSVNEWIFDASEEWGRTISEIIDESNVDFLGVAILSLKTNAPKIIEAFANLKIIGTFDCPDCGGELERFEDGDGVDVWNVERCSCGYYESTEPERSEAYEDF